MNTLGPFSREEWDYIQQQIEKPKTLEDYRKLYKFIGGKVVEFTEDEYAAHDMRVKS